MFVKCEIGICCKNSIRVFVKCEIGICCKNSIHLFVTVRLVFVGQTQQLLKDLETSQKPAQTVAKKPAERTGLVDVIALNLLP